MLSICIPLKNRGEHLINCLDALNKLDGIDEVVIGDFHSADIDLSQLHYKFPIVVVQNEDPFSVGAGKNSAAQVAKGDILFFLDADVITPQHVIDKILYFVLRGWVYCPIMWLEASPYPEEANEHPAGWGISSHGQIAVTKKQWQNHKWREWSSYGGEDDLFFEVYKETAITDLAMDFVHQWHNMRDRTKFHSRPAHADLLEYIKETYPE